MLEARVRIDQLVKRYEQFVAVDGVSLDIASGELFGLLGPNGAGKTTLMRMLIGQLRPSSGSITVAGLDCFAERAGVMGITGYVPDEPFFHDFLTGRELIRYVAALHGLAMDDAGPRADDLVQRLALDEALDEYAVNYSKGMKKKLAVVLALLHQPRLLVMDEPTNGLDPHSTRVLHAAMLELRTQGVTVIFSTHLLEQVERLASQVAIMARGRIAASGTLAELRARRDGDATLEEVFFSVTAGSAAAGSPADPAAHLAPRAGDGTASP